MDSATRQIIRVSTPLSVESQSSAQDPPLAWNDSELIAALDSEQIPPNSGGPFLQVPQHQLFSTHPSWQPYNNVYRPYDNVYRPYDNTPYRSYHNLAFKDSLEDQANLRRKQTLLREESFGASVSPPSGSIFRINHAALKFLQLLSKGNSTLSRYASGLFPKQSADTKEDLFLDRCRELGWKDAPSNWRRVGKLRAAKRTDILSAPYTVYLYPSLHCNLESICNKCYVSFGGSRYRSKIFLPEQLQPVVAELAALGVFHIVILGGEPLAYPYLLELLSILSTFDFNVSFSTNGMLLTPILARRLAELVDRIQVSIDGPDRSIAEEMKGQGTFEQSVNALKLLTDVGIATIAAYVLTPFNASNEMLEAFVQRMDKAGVNHVSFIQYYPSGDNPRWDRVLSFSENVRIARKVKQLQEEHPRLLISHEHTFGFLESQPIPTRARILENTNRGCDCGQRRISIYPNGDIVPCDFLAQNGAFVVGNIFVQSVDEVWQSSEALERFRSRACANIAACVNCPYHASCGGGCQAMAWMAFGDVRKADPRCPIAGRERVLCEMSAH